MSLHAEILATNLFNYFTHAAHTFHFFFICVIFNNVSWCSGLFQCSSTFWHVPLSRKFCRGPVSHVLVLTILVRYLMLPKRYKYLYKTFKSTLLNKVNISNQGKCLSLCKGNFWKIELLQFLGLEM